MMSLVLASASPARARLLRSAGVRIEIMPAAINEEEVKADCRNRGLGVREMAITIAERKARRVAADCPDRLVLGADQILDLDGEAVGKCAGPGEAASLLARLRGRTHELITAAALAKGRDLLWHHVERCRLVMRNFSDAFLADYLSRAGDAVLSAVGCYEIEGLGAQLFEEVQGDMFAVTGLPLLPLLQALRRQDLLAT